MAAGLEASGNQTTMGPERRLKAVMALSRATPDSQAVPTVSQAQEGNKYAMFVKSSAMYRVGQPRGFRLVRWMSEGEPNRTQSVYVVIS